MPTQCLRALPIESSGHPSARGGRFPNRKNVRHQNDNRSRTRAQHRIVINLRPSDDARGTSLCTTAYATTATCTEEEAQREAFRLLFRRETIVRQNVRVYATRTRLLCGCDTRDVRYNVVTTPLDERRTMTLRVLIMTCHAHKCVRPAR